MASGLVINSVQDVLAIALRVLESAHEEVVWLVPSSIHSLSMTHGFFERTRAFVERGGVSRGIVPISYGNIEEIQMSVQSGENIRHSDEPCEVFMYVADKQESVSSINIGVTEVTPDTPISAFWSDDPVYAEYLLTSFEAAWSQAVPAEEQIQELQGQGVGEQA